MQFEALCQLVADTINIDVLNINKESRLRDDLGIDSLQMVNLIIEITVKYAIDLQDVKSFDQIKTIGNIYDTLVLQKEGA